MYRNLYLIRHAQALEKAISQTDLERELTFKGRNDSIELGNYLFNQKIKLDILLSSPAVRTQNTASLIAESLFLSPEKMLTNDNLYHATPEDMFGIVRSIKSEFQHVALVGHNPTISTFASNLSSKSIDGFSPCTLAIFQFTVQNWCEIAPKIGSLLLIRQPPIF